jgi:nucleotide-binding universal stress UspA family protein
VATVIPRHEDEPRSQPAASPCTAYNVLVAFDGSRGAQYALGAATAMARGGNGRLTLMTVVPRAPMPAPGVVGAYDFRAIERAMEADLRAAAETVPDDVPVTTVVLHGNAAHEIVRCVEKGCYDVVVLGFEGHGPMKGAIAGVSKKVMRNCTVPVIVVHAPPE